MDAIGGQSVFRVVPSQSNDCNIWNIRRCGFDWHVLEPVAIICFGNVCNYGFMWFE